ncbi:hypothetical protein FRC09_010590 [Ceratobasidium sp. 395]|nr:hypothetical protein FRC09_010590 [Ceratobasidium sp. 395]
MARPSGISSHDLVFYTDMALVGVLGVVTLVYLPRTITHYLHKSSRREGRVLRRSRTNPTGARSPLSKDIPLSTVRTTQYPLDRSGSYSATPSVTPHLPERSLLSTGPRTPPPHLHSYTSYIPTIGRILNHHILGLTVHQLAILAAYILVTAIALFYQSNPTTNVPRAGYVVLSQMPIVFALGTKNSVVSLLTGISYEKVWKHQPKVAVPYVATCIALYGADQLARLAKTRVRKAILTPLPELGSTQMQILGINSGWTAGQHVRIRVLSFGVGLFGWTEAHPFTIANSGNGSTEGITLICKNAGDWTSGLYKMASGDSKDQYRITYVLVEGPYGGSGNTMFNSFSGAMLVLGGSGITFGTSVLEELVTKSLSGDSRVLCIQFIWVVQHPSASASFMSSFTQLIQRTERVPNLQLSISVFCTRGSGEQFDLPPNLPSNIQVKSGRPNLGNELNQLISSTQSSISASTSKGSGVILAACGPKSLISSTLEAKAGIPDEVQKAVGGLELHNE